MLSVVIPTLNAAAVLPPCLEALAPALADGAELVVSDGGSVDATQRLALAHGARWIAGARGRGVQLARGAEAAQGDWLLFLHADTVLAPGWYEAAGRFADDKAHTEKAAAFRFRLADEAAAARRLERLVAWRCRLLALPYGDQGLLVPRRLYDHVGGFRDLPLMEDVDLSRRLTRFRLHFLPVDAVTSAARYQQRGYLRRMLRNASLLTLYLLGVHPGTLAAFYED